MLGHSDTEVHGDSASDQYWEAGSGLGQLVAKRARADTTAHQAADLRALLDGYRIHPERALMHRDVGTVGIYRIK